MRGEEDCAEDEEYLLSIISRDSEPVSREVLLDAHRALSVCAERRNDNLSALEHFERYNELKEEIHRESKEVLLMELEEQHELRKKEQEAEIFRLRHVQLAELNRQLVEALQQIDELSDLLPICAGCKSIRNDSGYWERIESYIEEHSEAQMVRSLCPECSRELQSGSQEER